MSFTKQNPIELNNVRVLSTTYEKLLITINEEQSLLLKGITPSASGDGVVVKEKESEEYGTSYTVVIKVVNDRLCDLYKTIKRKDVVKACYDIAIVPVEWVWLDKTGVRLDAYMVKKLEPVIIINPLLQRMIQGPGQVPVGVVVADDGTSRDGPKKIKIPKLVRQ